MWRMTMLYYALVFLIGAIVTFVMSVARRT